MKRKKGEIDWKECKCTISQKLTGDGCEICNPELALSYAKETLAEYEIALNKAYKIINDLLNAEWMVTHDWGGDRDSLLRKAKKWLEIYGE